MSDYIYGLDFGTNNSVLAILETNSGEIVKIFSEKSTIYFPQLNRGTPLPPFFGDNAYTEYQKRDFTGRYMRSIKSVLNKPQFKYTTINGKNYTADDLVALVLKNLKTKADSFLGQNIDSVILGRPVVFDIDAEREQLANERLKNAAKLAGFNNVRLQFEPVGAAYKYLRETKGKCLLFVADIGAGTSDFTIFRIDEQLHISGTDLYGKRGVRIGGDNFDAAIVDKNVAYEFGRDVLYQSMNKTIEVPGHYYHLLQKWQDLDELYTHSTINKIKGYHAATKFNEKYGNLVKLVEHHLGHSLLFKVEETKIALSKSASANFEFLEGGINISKDIQLSEFEDSISKYTDKLEGLVNTYLSEVQLTPSEFDKVFLTGGSSLIPAIRKIFTEKFGQSKVVEGEAFKSVAEGLAYSALL